MALLMGGASPAHAGGGAEVVDDASVEIPGTCHFESWVTRYGSHSGLANFSPGCTRQTWQNLEIGAGIQHAWDGRNYTDAGPALKLHVWSLGPYEGAAVSGSASLNTRTGKLDSASVTVPFTLPLSRRVNFSVNLGYSYLRLSAQPHSLFWGSQIEARVGRDVTLMAEGFGRASGPAGGQTGLRWNPRGGTVDLDLFAGRYVDGVSPTAVTIGLTVRR